MFYKKRFVSKEEHECKYITLLWIQTVRRKRVPTLICSPHDIREVLLLNTIYDPNVQYIDNTVVYSYSGLLENDT